MIPAQLPWAHFSSSPQEIITGPSEPDFVSTTKQDAKKETSTFDSCLMTLLYPVQSPLIKRIWAATNTTRLDEQRSQLASTLAGKGFIVRHLKLNYQDICYSGLLIAHNKTYLNNKWAIQATGMADPIEKHLTEIDYVEKYHSIGYNLIMMNGPGVGRSEGQATGQTIGHPQHAALQFLESSMKAKRIVLAGFSLGGAAIAQATLLHTFEPKERQYLIVKQMTFDKISNVVKQFTSLPGIQFVAKKIASVIEQSSCETSCVEASIKLAQLDIHEVIIQSGTDSENFLDDAMIAKEASLAVRLLSEGITHAKRFIPVCGEKGIGSKGSHDPQLDVTIGAISDWEKEMNPPDPKTVTSRKRVDQIKKHFI